MNMRIEDARVICPCMMAPDVARRSRKPLSVRPRTARSLFVALVLATATLGFSVSVPQQDSLAATMRRTSGVVKVDVDPKKVPSLATGLRGEFATAVSSEDLESARREYFETRIPFGRLIYREAVRNGLQPELVAAVVRAESSFVPENVSVRNAIGLMQLIPSTGELMGAGDLTDPEENVRAGTKYLKYLSASFEGDEVLTLAAYNAGDGAVKRYGGVPPYRETREYITKVGRYRHEYAREVEQIASLRAVRIRAQ
jgi:soluble lytic murein transglycosylase-like protein